MYDPYTIEVTATRCPSLSYEDGVLKKRSLTEYTFSFRVSQYTLRYIYEEALKAIKEAKIRRYEVKA